MPACCIFDRLERAEADRYGNCPPPPPPCWGALFGVFWCALFEVVFPPDVPDCWSRRIEMGLIWLEGGHMLVQRKCSQCGISIDVVIIGSSKMIRYEQMFIALVQLLSLLFYFFNLCFVLCSISFTHTHTLPPSWHATEFILADSGSIVPDNPWAVTVLHAPVTITKVRLLPQRSI